MNVSVMFIASEQTRKESVETGHAILDTFFRRFSDLTRKPMACSYMLVSRSKREIVEHIHRVTGDWVLFVCDDPLDCEVEASVVSSAFAEVGLTGENRTTVFPDKTGRPRGYAIDLGTTQVFVCPGEPSVLVGMLQNGMGSYLRMIAAGGQRDVYAYASVAPKAPPAPPVTRFIPAAPDVPVMPDTYEREEPTKIWKSQPWIKEDPYRVRDNEKAGGRRTKTGPDEKSEKPAAARAKSPRRAPRRRLGKPDIFLRMLLVAVICMTSYFVFNLISNWVDDATSKNDYAQIAAVAHRPELQSNLPPEDEQSALLIPVSEDTKKWPVMRVDFRALRDLNSDVVGFVRVNDTKINYPVVQTQDNTFYLNHSFLQKPSGYGCVFLDSAAEVTPDRVSQNLVLYGHHMKNGEMFAELENYRDLNYYRAHPIIYFNTAYQDDAWRVFAVYIVNANMAGDEGNVFNYMQAEFSDDAAFEDFIKETKRRSVLNIPVDIQPEDQILTLSTCNYSIDDARLVVVAKRVTSAEEANVDVMQARNNPVPLYPSAWYVKYGGQKPTETQMQIYADIF